MKTRTVPSHSVISGEANDRLAKPELKRTFNARTLFALLVLLGVAFQTLGVVTPASNRAFSTNTTGTAVISHMQIEAVNPLVAGPVIHFINNSPVDVTGDGAADFEQWSGTLISPEWVLTCAHALQGTNGRGGGIEVGEIYYNYGGSAVPDPASAGIAEFRLHPAWTKQGYTNGYDIALVRLAVPVTNAVTFPHLQEIPFNGQVGVVFAGFGRQGDGDSGAVTEPGIFGVGLNSFDGVGGQWMTNGAGQASVTYSNWPASVAFMDFDRWEQTLVNCGGGITNGVGVALADFSSMGLEQSISAPARQPCGGSNPAILPGTFLSGYCDFLPSPGDSGGPALVWPDAPTVPATGFYLNRTPVLTGVASYMLAGTSTNANGLYGNVVAYTLVQPYTGWIYQETGLVGLAPATYVKNPADIQLVNLQILEERAVGNDETDIEFTSDLHNLDTGRYRTLSLNVNRGVLPATAIVVDPQLEYSALEELGTAVAGIGNTLIVRVANSDLSLVRQLIQSGDALDVTAYEEMVFSGPTKFIDAPTDNAFESTTSDASGNLVLVFKTSTTLLGQLRSGDILIADTTPGGYRPKQAGPTDPFSIPYLGQQVPFEVASVSVVNGKTQVAGHHRELNQILKSGTFVASDENYNGGGRDLLDPPVENTYTKAEKSVRDAQARVIEQFDPEDSRLADLKGLSAIPWHFNDVEITKFLHLSGQVLLRSSGLRFQVSFRDFAVRTAAIGIDAGVVASLVLETTGTNNNVVVPLVDKQKELAHLPLPVIPFNIAGVPCSINPSFVLSVGAEVNGPGGLSIPLETSITVGADVGWSDGQTFAAPIQEFAAPHVSDPTVFDAVETKARAWAEAKLEVNLSVAGGVAAAGPSLAIHAEAGFAVEPFNNPWWTLDAGVDLVGRFEMSLLGFNVAGSEATLPVANFFHRDAGGPLVPSGGPLFALAGIGGVAGQGQGGAAPPIDLGPKSGKNVRWGLAFSASNTVSEAYGKGFVVPLQGGGYCVGGSSAIPSFLGNISADGRANWLQTFPTGAKPVDAVQLPDGSIMVAGYAGFDWWLAHYTADGTRQWIHSYRTSADLQKLAFGTGTNGQPEYYLAGYQSLVSIRQSDPVVLKLDQDGNLVWSKVYTLNFDDEVYSIRTLRDGNLLLVGRTDSRVGTDLFVGAGGNGLLMKIAPTGDVLWARAIPGRWGMAFRDVVEGPDGSIYAVGSHGDIVRDYYPSILVAKFDATGQLLRHVLIGEDPDWADDLPNGGDTPYDYAAQAVWTSNGLVVVGTTGLGASASAWAATLTDELGVQWFSAFDGPGAATFDDVAVTDDGIVAMGWAENISPTRFKNRTPAWLLSLPWEGMVRFHPDTSAQSHYLQPRVYLSSSQPDFIGLARDAAQHVISVHYADVPFVISNSVVNVGANVSAGVFANIESANLERLDASSIDTFNEWVAYHQLSGTNALPSADTDGDGIGNGAEFYFGTSPFVSDTNALPKLSIQYDPATALVAIDFPRAHAAASLGSTLQYSTNLVNWVPANNPTVQVLSSDSTVDWLRWQLPAPDFNAAFFRLLLPITP